MHLENKSINKSINVLKNIYLNHKIISRYKKEDEKKLSIS